MITRGSRLFFGLAGAGLLAAYVYGVITNGLSPGAGGVWHTITGNGAVSALLGPITLGYKGGVGDHFGYTLFLGFAVTCAAMGFVGAAFRDADAEALAEVAGADQAPAVAPAPDLSPWPIVASFGVALVAIGLAMASILFSVGIVVLVIAAIEWTIKTWSEQATGDVEANQIIRARLMHPIEVPVAGVILIALVVFCFSRVLLATSQAGSIVAAIILGAVVLAIGAVIGVKRDVRRGVVVGVLVVAALVVIALGIWGAAKGERTFGEHASASSNSVSVGALGETSS